MANMTKDDEDVDVDNSPSPVSGCLSIKLDAADPKAKDRYSSPKANLCSGPLFSEITKISGGYISSN